MDHDAHHAVADSAASETLASASTARASAADLRRLYGSWLDSYAPPREIARVRSSRSSPAFVTDADSLLGCVVAAALASSRWSRRRGTTIPADRALLFRGRSGFAAGAHRSCARHARSKRAAGGARAARRRRGRARSRGRHASRAAAVLEVLILGLVVLPAGDPQPLLPALGQRGDRRLLLVVAGARCGAATWTSTPRRAGAQVGARSSRRVERRRRRRHSARRGSCR